MAVQHCLIPFSFCVLFTTTFQSTAPQQLFLIAISSYKSLGKCLGVAHKVAAGEEGALSLDILARLQIGTVTQDTAI